MPNFSFNNQAVELMGRTFSSKLEASVFQLLSFRFKAQEIKELECQVTVEICGPRGHECKRPIKYIPDFRYFNLETTKYVYAEAKGYEDPRWPMKKNLWRHYGPGPLVIYKGTHLRPVIDEVLQGGCE